ncbi:cell division protein ZapE [Thalassomonas viridans]|uniref:Cell division protein ZapE n=1 Tax=Thalassomonas viridans TaxID=137584 RepID=A0AAE9Z539_9GAMM|nr:cell division protein ZapE [Thalassomonas viridans]WDE06820.1 cell division protein ZapE [Thalassomonas viridans]
MKLAYQALLDNRLLLDDPAQLAAVEALSDLSRALKKAHRRRRSFPGKILGAFCKPQAVPGIYFHGRVGRGKTMLMNLFYRHLEIRQKKRIHFHRFMESVHQQLNDLPVCDNPLKHIARKWAADIQVLCFDEFFVSDIGDAMLISGVLNALFENGVTLVATSNCRPEDLYRNGLQRQRFLPTIDILYQQCRVISVDGDKDHRLSALVQQEQVTPLGNLNRQGQKHYRDYCYHSPDAASWLNEAFLRLTKQQPHSGEITVNHRIIPYKGKVVGGVGQQNVIWFDFNALCAGPRSQLDYISLANQFSVVLLEAVPQFAGERIQAVASGVEDGYQRKGTMLNRLQRLDDEARRFIALVDEFYDRKVRLIISAAVDIDDLYQGQELSFEFARCRSRLIEMQFIQYDSQEAAIA